MTDRRRPSRRAVLIGAGGVAFGSVTAGCLDGGSDDPADDGTDDDAPGDPADDGTGTDGLDLREANVVGVSVEVAGDSHRFDVTLHHDDDGEDGYADWWQVERPGGALLGRRELLHAHSTQPFTRSATVEIPPGVTCVVVRGHDRTHGYGGQAMLVHTDSGATQAIRQGTERQSLEERECP